MVRSERSEAGSEGVLGVTLIPTPQPKRLQNRRDRCWAYQTRWAGLLLNRRFRRPSGMASSRYVCNQLTLSIPVHRHFRAHKTTRATKVQNGLTVRIGRATH